MSNTTEQARDAALRQLIAVRAYEMWENQGRPYGRDMVHWRQAEQDVMSAVVEGSGGRNVAAPAALSKAPRQRKKAAP